MRTYVFFLGLAICAWGYATAAEDRDQPLPLTEAVKEKCLAVLRAGLVSDEFWPAMHAAEALTLAGKGDEVRAALRPRLPLEKDEQRRCGLVREMARAGDRTTIPVLWQILADEKSNGRVHAAESLYKIAELDDGRQMRSVFASTDNLRLKMMAAAALARGGSPAAYKLLREKMSDDDVEIRKISAWVLGLLGDQRDVAPLQKGLAAEKDPLAQAYFVNALACLRDEKGRESLIKNLASADGPIRTYSADFAGYARAVEAQSKLIEMLDDPVLDVRVRSAQALIAFSLPPPALQLPIAAVADSIHSDVFPGTREFPNNSLGSIIPLQDDSLLYAASEFVVEPERVGASLVSRRSRDGGRTWEPKQTLQENIAKEKVTAATLRRLPDENQRPSDRLGLFFAVHNGGDDLDVMFRVSTDDGRTFGPATLITQKPGYHYMINDRVTVTRQGRILCPVSTGTNSSSNHFTCVCHFSDDGGKTWKQSADSVDQPKRGAFEPEIVELADGQLLMIVRTQLGHIATSTSSDGGDHWSEPGKLPVVAPEAPATIRTIPATGDLLLVWNNNYRAGQPSGGARTPLSTAISSDGGQTWRNTRNLETDPDMGFAYASVLFHKDRVLFSYNASSKSGVVSSRFRSLPVRWLYETP